MGVSMLWTMNPIEGLAVWNRWIVVLLASVLCSAFLLYENKTLKALIVTTIVIAIINVLSCIIFYYVFDVHISQRNNLKLNGFYGNKNIFAFSSCLDCCVWSGLSVFWRSVVPFYCGGFTQWVGSGSLPFALVGG